MRVVIATAVLCFFVASTLLGQTASHIVISEVYGGGGNTGSTWKNDFVELYNPTNDPVVMTDWSLQYQSASGTGAFGSKAIFSGTIMPRGFFLVQLAQGAGGTTALPTPDATPLNTLLLSATAGKVALVRDTLSVTNANDPNVVDFVGYGNANKFEGTGAALTLSNTTSAERKASGSSTASSLAQGGSEQNAGNGWDSDSNVNDFVVQAAINPQNSASPKEPAGSVLAGIGTALMNPSVVKADTGITLSFIIRGSTQGTITRIKIPHEWPFDWSRASADVLASSGGNGTVLFGTDTLIVNNVAITGQDSITIRVSKLTAQDTTVSITFRLETAAGSDSTALVSPLPKVLLYGNPRPVAEMRANNALGVPINLQKLVTVRGIVTVSTQFGSPAFVQDVSGGIAVFDNAFVANVSVGDEVTFTGTVTQFNGLTELENVTLHAVHGSGNTVLPVTVTASQLSSDGAGGLEVYEGMLVQLNRVIVRDTLEQVIPTWQVLPGQSGANYRLKDASGIMTVRIDKDVDFANASAPAGEFDIVGIVSQFVPTSPYIGGYQLQPRWRNDIIASGPLITVQPLETNISPNSLTITWQTASPGSSVVRYRNLKTSEVGVVEDGALKTLHALKLSGLSPAAPYTVQAYSVSGADTSFSANRVVSTASQGSSGAINVYFNKSVNVSLARPDTAKGNASLPDRLLQRINNAQKSIDCALYSISGSVGQQIASALVQAKNRGVSIRVIIEKDNLSAGTGTTFSQVITPAGIPWIADNFDPVNAGAGLHHNKFFVVDHRGGAPDQAWVWTGSWNLTDPGTADDMQNAIEIQDQALAGAYTIEFNEMWGSENETQNSVASRFGARKLDNTPHLFDLQGTPIELYFSPSDRTTGAIIKALNTAHHSINAALLTFTRSDIASTLKAKKESGVKVRALLDNNTDTGSQFGFMMGAGIEVRLDPAAGLLHHKYAVIDAEVNGSSPYVITGSHNWTSSAENSNNENTLIIQSARVANQYLQEFAARYKEAGGTDNIIVSVKENGELPDDVGLSQNYPNPFNGMTTVEFRLSSVEWVSLKVFDVLGREVATMVNDEKPAGVYRVTWDASILPSGVYLCRLQAGAWTETRRMVLIK